ncbi:transducin beta 3 [Brachionus plicatilis]|uniref:Transducin beta 3 n=1 Tax=Brachionus plicatilis TaxID=10195 RepID=A0A3M7SBN9_BRAPC|nr:transducin beta 3 [Brachionus plicatilis]
MKHIKQSLKIDRVKETQYTGGNICVTSCGKYLFCIYGTSVNVIDIQTGSTKHSLESEEEEVTCITLSPDDKHLITAHKNLLLKQWDNWGLFEETDTKKVTTKCTRTWKAIHTAPIHCMCFDSSSILLATGSSDYTVKVWDIQAQYCTHNLKGAQGIIRSIVFYPDIQSKQQLVTGAEDGKIRVYNLNNSQMVACLEGHFSTVTSLEYLHGDKLISSSRDKVLIIWNLESFTKLKTVPVYESIESILVDSRIEDNQNERFVITMGNDGLLKIWDTKKSKILYQQNEAESLRIQKRTENELEQVISFGIYNKKVNTLFLVTSDQMIVFVRVDSDLIRKMIDKEDLDESDGAKVFTHYKQYIGDHGEILDLQYCSQKQNLLAMATNSEFLKVYDLNTWDCRLLKGHTDLVICLAVYVDKNSSLSYLASSSKDNTIRLWSIDSELNTFECILVCRGHTQDVGALAFSHLGLQYLISGSIDTTIKSWKILIDKKNSQFKMDAQFTIKAHEKDINSVCVSANDKLIASGSSDKTAKVWDSSDGICLGVLRGHKRGVWCVQFSTVDQLLVTSSADGTIKLWSLGDFSCVKTFEGHSTSVLRVSFLNNGTQLISSASDGLVKLWNIKTNECVGTFDEHEDKVWALSGTKDETQFVSGGADGKLIVWKDVTDEMYEEELEKREEILLKEQELDNYLKEKKWKKALGLAIQLDKPFRCYEIIQEILLSNIGEDSGTKENKGRRDLERTFLKLRDDQIKSLLKYANDWNTNTKFCLIAQVVFELIMRNYPPEFLIDESNYEFAAKIIEQFLPYSERHFARLNKLSQQIMFLDFAWQNMKLEDKKIENK